MPDGQTAARPDLDFVAGRDGHGKSCRHQKDATDIEAVFPIDCRLYIHAGRHRGTVTRQLKIPVFFRMQPAKLDRHRLQVIFLQRVHTLLSS